MLKAFTLKRHGPGYYSFANEHDRQGHIKRVDGRGWIVVVDNRAYEYSDFLPSYAVAKTVAREFGEAFDD